MNRRTFVASGLSAVAWSRMIGTRVLQNIGSESAKLIGGAIRVPADEGGGDFLIALSEAGQGVVFSGVAGGSVLSIRYASLSVGTVSVAVNDEKPRKINVHSSGALTSSYVEAIVEMKVPRGASVTVSLAADDVGINLASIRTGAGEGGLPVDIWNLEPLQIAEGPYSADWKALARNYSAPAWWRDAKFGAWSHWDPQSMPEQGDWYARGMYQEGSPQYESHLKRFGHPSEFGYKDICHQWKIDRWNPEELMSLYVGIGARYFMAMGCHHDNFDCFDSKYQPWNSVEVGPKVDIVGTWEKVARSHGMRFGIGFHDTPPRTWGQFMPVRYSSDKKGPMKGVPYDALQTVRDGKGKWWEGKDPVDFYGPAHTPNDPLHSPFANQFMRRVDDAITKYHPDVIYFDEHAGDSQIDMGVHMGLGYLAPELIANYYNKYVHWNHGKMEAVVNLKGVGGRYNSFQDHPELLNDVDRALVKSTEAVIEPEIMAYPFQTETSISDWHYKTGQKYMDAKSLVNLLMQNVCRNGTMLLNLTQHGRGDLDPEVVQIARDMGAWLKVNGEAVYNSRPFEVYGDTGVCYTRNQGYVYATLLDWTGGPVSLKALHAGGATLGKVSKVELLGSEMMFTFVQDGIGLTVTPGGAVKPLPGIASKEVASACRTLRITQDKRWINDDDVEAIAKGWLRRSNLGTGDYNNDVTTSATPGDVWSCSFTGTSVTVVAPREQGAGKIDLEIDGHRRATADLSTTGEREAQQKICRIDRLSPGKHTISLINQGPGPVSFDALIVE